MNKTLKSKDIETGYHPDGYRIDKTASPINRYTKWDIAHDGRWTNLKPVCFHSLPEDGWISVDSFDWNDKENTQTNKMGSASGENGEGSEQKIK